MSAVVLILLMIEFAYSREQYSDQYKNSPPAVRQWFRGVRSPQGVPCCDVADGHRVDWQRRDDGYFWVYFADDWRRVPRAAEVKEHDNPTGDAVVWYVDNQPGNSPEASGPDRYFIRCFVPGPEQ